MIGLLVLLACTAGIGAPETNAPLLQKPVYPLEKQDDVWWVGIADICDIVDATMEGAEAVLPLDLPEGHRMVVGIPGAAGDGPLKVAIGEDTYEFMLGKTELEKNGRPAWDFGHAPRRISGIPSAALGDMAHMLGLAEGEEADGQPTIFRDGIRYRLVRGRPIRRFSYLHVQDADGNLLWKYEGPPLAPTRLIQQLPVGKYAEYNGALYLRGSTRLHRLDTESQSGSTETLYGPVIPHRYEAEGVLADQLYLSIVHARGRPVQMVADVEALRELQTQRAVAAAEREAIAAELRRLEQEAAARPGQGTRKTESLRALEQELRETKAREEGLEAAIRWLRPH